MTAVNYDVFDSHYAPGGHMPQDDTLYSREPLQAAAANHRLPAKFSSGQMPLHLQLLCIAPREPSFRTLTLNLHELGCREPEFRWVDSPSEALAILRKDHFDCLILSGGSELAEQLELAQAIRAGGYDEPVILLAANIRDLAWAEAMRLECEVLSSTRLFDSPALAQVVERAITRVEMSRENRRFSIADHHRVNRERDEAEQLLKQQKQMIADLRLDVRLNPETAEFYQELLRTYVMMGSGSLKSEIAKVAASIADARLSLWEALDLHLERVESLVRGLGNRSARHVMARADLLALELMIHLGEHYRRGPVEGPA